MSGAENIAQFLSEKFGLALDARLGHTDEGRMIELRPGGVEPTIAFKIVAIHGWRSFAARFIPDPFSKRLLSEMSKASLEHRILFSSFAQAIKEKGASLSLLIDGEPHSAVEADGWPQSWENIEFSMRLLGVFSGGDDAFLSSELAPVMVGFVGMTLSLLPLVEAKPEPALSVWELEGSKISQVVLRYERSPMNRAACLQFHGTACTVCGLDFGSKYGEIGFGFIHVHHKVPLALMGGEYALNPRTDLVPVCPNCHAMLHRREPPLSVEELRSIVNGSS